MISPEYRSLIPATPRHPIIQLLIEASSRRPSGWALRDTVRELSYTELLQEVLVEGGRLANLGVHRGAPVMIEATQNTRYLTAYFAALHLGANVLPYDASTGPEELEREMARYGVLFYLVPGDSIKVSKLSGLSPHCIPYLAELDDGSCVLLPTGAAEGQPKRAIHTTEGLIGNASAYANSVGLNADDVTMIMISPTLGICHTGQILAHMLVAGRIAFSSNMISPDDLVREMQDVRTTNVTLLPDLLGDAMLNALARVPTLRQISIDGTASTKEFLPHLASRMKEVDIVQTWGASGCGPILTVWLAGRDPLSPGCVGTPVRGVDMEIRSPKAKNREFEEDGSVGELCARTSYAMHGYLSGDEADGDVSTEPELIRTGYLGYADNDGRVYVKPQ